jgi:hypothetical protein
MTLIMGLNLSDKVYLAADTRITFGDGSTCDDGLKILPILDRANHKTNSVTLAVAGDIALAAFLHEKISKALNSGELSPDIRELYKVIKPFIQNALTEWTCKDPGQLTCLLFSGIWTGRPKPTDANKLSELVVQYAKKVKDGEANRKSLAMLVETDPTWKMINEKMQKDSGMTVLENMAKSDTPAIPKYIEDAIANNASNIPEMPDSLIFSAMIEPVIGTIDLEKAEWGEFLAYGPSIRKEDLPQEILATLEFSPGKEKNMKHLIEGGIMSITILDIARENNIKSIGGTVVIVSADKDGEEIMGKDIVFREKNTGVNINGTILPLIPFNIYAKKKSQPTTGAKMILRR